MGAYTVVQENSIYKREMNNRLDTNVHVWTVLLIWMINWMPDEAPHWYDSSEYIF